MTKPDLSFRKDSSACVFVGDFGQTVISPEVLRAYGIEQWPIDRRSSIQRRALERLNRIVPVLQEHAWLMETHLTELVKPKDHW